MDWTWKAIWPDNVWVVCFGLFIPGAALCFWVQHLRYKKWTKATGTVIRVADDDEGRESLVGFETADGEHVEFWAGFWSGGQTGQQVEVLFNPRKPKVAKIDRWAIRHYEALWLFGVGVLPFLAVAVFWCCARLATLLGSFSGK